MDAAMLAASQPGLSLERAAQLVDGANQAMLLGDVTTVARAAMFLAQVGHESVSLQYTQEIQPPPDATYPPYVGRTFMQITWDYNYLHFGQWLNSQGLLDDAYFFVNNPESLAADEWAWLGAVWYWTTHNLNGPSDQGDVVTATEIINGGTNGLDARISRYETCLALGDAILPAPPVAPAASNVTPLATSEEDDMYDLYQVPARLMTAAGVVVPPNAGRVFLVPSSDAAVPFWASMDDIARVTRFGKLNNPGQPKSCLQADIDGLVETMRKGLR